MVHMQVPFYRHSLAPENSKYVAQVLETPFLTSGPIGKEVEAQLSVYFGAKHSKLVNSWTNGAVLYSDGFGANSYLLGLTAPINSASKVFASYQAANPTGNFSGVGAAQSIYSVGYDYNFSKRTTAYAAVSYANNYMMIDGAKSTVLMTGVRHQF